MTAPPAQFDIYEVHTLHGHTVTPEEAAANAVTIPDIEAHAVVIANAKFARAYGEPTTTKEEVIDAAIELAGRGATEGDVLDEYFKLCRPLSEITNVAYSAPDTTVTFANITEGEQIDLFIPIASSAPLSDVQFGISHDPRFYDYEGDCITGDGRVFIQNPIGNDDLKNFIASLYDTGDATIWDKTWLLDVTDSPTHDVFFEVHLSKYERTQQGTIRVTFTFELPQDIHSDNTTPCHPPTSKTPHIEATRTAPPKPRSRLMEFLLPSQ